MEESLISERAKAQEANAMEGENDPWSMWGLSKKGTKKKKAKKRDASCHDAPRCDAPADTSPTAMVENSFVRLNSDIQRSIASKHAQDATETKIREVSFSTQNSTRSQATKIPATNNIKSESVGFSGLHSSKSTRRLEQIADLRARGIGDHIDLPQLIVCGDQSAGKSSVLEGLTGLPFPRQDGVCTKFATEIILQHSIGEQSITATILPSSSRSESFKIMLRSYRQQLQDFDELPVAITEAGSLMGIRGFGDVKAGPAFAEDFQSWGRWVSKKRRAAKDADESLKKKRSPANGSKESTSITNLFEQYTIYFETPFEMSHFPLSHGVNIRL